MKEMYLTPAQQKAIKNLEKAISEVGKAGIQICGMDNNIIYAANKAIKATPGAGNNYCHVADTLQHWSTKGDITGIVNTGNVYQDSGGW